MKIIIVGVGKLGEYLAKSLVHDENEVTLIDKTFESNQEIINNEDLNYICGNGLDANILLKAGIKESDLLISVMELDEQNAMCCLLGKKLGVKHTIARIRTPEYANSIRLLKDELGLSMTINPEKLTASYISRILSIPSAIDATVFFKGRIQMISLKVKENSILQGITVNNLSKSLSGKVIICAIERNDKIIIPRGNIKIIENDILRITGTPKDIHEFLRYTKDLKGKTKSVLICGGSDTSIYLSKMLIEMGMKVKIIEIDPQRCEILSEQLPESLIINGDVSNQNTLYEEGIDKVDSFVALTSIDEENIVYSMFASRVNVPKIITKVNHINLDYVIDMANIDSVITPHKIASNQIVSYVRAMKNGEKSSCESIYRFSNDQVEMIEFNIKDDFKGLDYKISDLDIKDGIIITAILRGKNIIFPGGKDTIKLNDTIIITSNNNDIQNINDIIE